MSAPTLPPAPARLSTMNCWPNALDSSGAIARARMSVVPPAANGTTMRTGLVGQLLWAQDGAAMRASAVATEAASAVRRLEGEERKEKEVMRAFVHGGAACVAGENPVGATVRPPACAGQSVRCENARARSRRTP